MLRFYTHIPPGNGLEVARILTSVKHLKQMVDMLAHNLDYYPERPSADVPEADE